VRMTDPNRTAVRYRTIVADPPWEYAPWPVSSSPTAQNAQYAKRRGLAFDPTLKKPLPYPSMTLAEIEALPVGDLAARDAHLYLWTTAKYLWYSRRIVRTWGFDPGPLLHWCKTPMGIGPGGTWASNVEYVLVARRGSLPHSQRFDTRWFNWPRMGRAHSRKPEAMLDMVEAASRWPLPRAVRPPTAAGLGHVGRRGAEPCGADRVTLDGDFTPEEFEKARRIEEMTALPLYLDLTLRCPVCGRRADMCFDHGDDWKKRP
jgi:hypothetical protein